MSGRMIAVVGAIMMTAQVVAASEVVFNPSNGTLQENNSWTSILYVNGTAFPLTHTCTMVDAMAECTAPLPNIQSALTPSGPQTFRVSLYDPILMVESGKSAPFIRVRPGAPTSGRLK